MLHPCSTANDGIHAVCHDSKCLIFLNYFISLLHLIGDNVIRCLRGVNKDCFAKHKINGFSEQVLRMTDAFGYFGQNQSNN